jgi:cation diffusion facilitator CzcD-associated flavoprotein CzcO
MSNYTDIIIVGSGFAGLGMGIHLQKLGKHSFCILEKSNDVGGTWRDNSYPGAACDVPSHVYSFSFEPYPKWTNSFAPQQEIQEYIQHCVTKYKLRDSIKFNQTVVEARYDKTKHLWHITTADGTKYTSRVLVAGTGPLNKEKYPDIPGLDSFAGKMFHTSSWNHQIDIKGKKVAVVGTGASAIQVIPAIAPMVEKLLVFQRTPAWVIPRPSRTISSFERKVFAKFPFVQQFIRFLKYWLLEIRAVAFVLFPWLMNGLRLVGKMNIAKGVKDKKLRKKLTPNYMIGCKRILLSNDYYPTFERNNVELIQGAVTGLHPSGVERNDKLYEADVIVFATGFEASENMAAFKTYGKKGIELSELWKNGGEAYWGTTVSGFPNMFHIIGPNTGLGHNSMIHIIESQIAYIMGAIEVLFDGTTQEVDVKQTVQNTYNEQVQQKMKNTIWIKGGCNSWYLNANGKNTTLWPSFTFIFRKMTSKFDKENYEIA